MPLPCPDRNTPNTNPAEVFCLRRGRRWVRARRSRPGLTLIEWDGASRPPLTASARRADIVRASDGQFIGLASGY